MTEPLEDIGFYTLSDERASMASVTTPMYRCELILLDRCNFKCPYCRGLRSDCQGTMPLHQAAAVLDLWIADGLRNVRFSGGEPTLYDDLEALATRCMIAGVGHIALSTNGSADTVTYANLLRHGVNDVSVSLDACCAGDCETMSGSSTFDWVVGNIEWMARRTYVTVGVVVTPENIATLAETVAFASSLGVADIRIIPAAQNNELKLGVDAIPRAILDKHPILAWRVARFKAGCPVRGLRAFDSHTCHLLVDDSVIAGKWHFPCVIYLREGGDPIGLVGTNMRQERLEWIRKTDTHKEPICAKNCLDFCIAFNNKAQEARGGT